MHAPKSGHSYRLSPRPLFPHPKTFCTYNPTRNKAVAAIVLGFFAMLRFHSYGKLQLQNLTIVLKGGEKSFQAFTILELYKNY